MLVSEDIPDDDRCEEIRIQCLEGKLPGSEYTPLHIFIQNWRQFVPDEELKERFDHELEELIKFVESQTAENFGVKL